MRFRPRPRDRAGYTLIDALVAIAVVAVVGLFSIMALTRGRESARSVTCQRNLAQIGLALAFYDQTQGALPMIGEPSPIDPPPASGSTSPGPLKTLLETLGVSSLLGMEPEGRNLDRLKGPVLQGIAVPGFFCASDPRATGRVFPSPVSYRATTGDDAEGRTGGFAIGKRTTLAEIEAADGLSYTAAFSERLVGDGRPRQASENYALVDGPLSEQGCSPDASGSLQADWRGDAGASWNEAGWPSTLYNHAMPPGSKISCLTRDGRSARIGASSGHVAGVGLLMFDGSVKRIVWSVNPSVWREFATVSSPHAPVGPPAPAAADRPKPP
ncbi:MAG: DUF1559 domain-containing protein [Paludisphaera borealis]|uniref:type II secretion system protein n=1 Tax=Paludisphaera borealis TaxID=1387353 RepID=UPI00283E0FB6|nr:DUF1559 domain-containing protein [Paludisphaera borealis]MDR3620296.1 DUF1559 domain-containing protein [Paludisphaera borealis]